MSKNNVIKVVTAGLTAANATIKGLNQNWKGAVTIKDVSFSASKGKTVDTINAANVEMEKTAAAATLLMDNTVLFIQKSETSYSQADQSAAEKIKS